MFWVGNRDNKGRPAAQKMECCVPIVSIAAMERREPGIVEQLDVALQCLHGCLKQIGHRCAVLLRHWKATFLPLVDSIQWHADRVCQVLS